MASRSGLPYGICQQGDKITEEPIEMPRNKIEEAIATPSGAMDFSYANFAGALQSTPATAFRSIEFKRCSAFLLCKLAHISTTMPTASCYSDV
jgi:hypothetical protein